jgi:hypothetical protein
MTLFLLALVPACADLLANNLASLGGDTAGGRGTIDVIFDNQTPYRAIFTVGVYDPQDQTSEPTFVQYAVDTDQTATAFNRGLAAETVTTRGTLQFSCGRVVSIGGAEMIDLIQSNDLTPLNSAPIIDAALREGIYFSDKTIDDDDANGVDDPVLHADPVVAYLGTDFECDALLIFTISLDSDQADGVRVTLDVIPNEETD